MCFHLNISNSKLSQSRTNFIANYKCGDMFGLIEYLSENTSGWLQLKKKLMFVITKTTVYTKY